MKKFWDNPTNPFKVDPDSLFRFLNVKGFFTFLPRKSSSSIFVRIKDKIVEQVSRSEIRKYCWDYINKTFEFDNPHEQKRVANEFVNSKVLFSQDNMDLLNEAEIKEVKDTKSKSYLFFSNSVLEITAQGIQKKEYAEIDGHVWDKDIIKFDLRCTIPKEVSPSGEFYEFFQDITKHPNKHIQGQNGDSLVTIIGYLLHRYKDPANPRAVILMDSFKDGNPQGGTGKGIFCKALEKIRTLAFQNGKQHRYSDPFALSNVSYGTRILLFDDVPRNFDFERLFPTITEDTVVEKKYINKFSIPFDESPKVLITTNYTVGGEGDSHKRRKIEFILSDTYSADYTPEHRFGHLLFRDWNQMEWESFYLFMAYCIQMFLFGGIVEPKFNVAERRLKQSATEEFIQYVDRGLELGVKYNKKEVFEAFVTKFPNHPAMEQNTFTRWLKLFADAYGMKVSETHSGEDNFFELTT